MTDLFYQQMEAACEQIGVKMISDDTCLKLLAVVYVYGDESAVYSLIMRRDIQTACKRFHIGGGMMPLMDCVKLAAYVSELYHNDAPWLAALQERYQVTFPPCDTPEPLMDWEDLLHGSVRIPKSQHGQAGQ